MTNDVSCAQFDQSPIRNPVHLDPGGRAGKLDSASRTKLPDVVYTILAVVHRITSPIMEPIRRVIPPLGGLDMSPIIALIGLGNPEAARFGIDRHALRREPQTPDSRLPSVETLRAHFASRKSHQEEGIMPKVR